jgi:hypothetical protein
LHSGYEKRGHKVDKGKCDTCLNTASDHIGLITKISWLC